MKKVNPIYYFVPFLYVAIILLLVFFQWQPQITSLLNQGNFTVKESLAKSRATREKAPKVQKPKTQKVAKEKMPSNKTNSSSASALKFEKQIGAIQIVSKKNTKDDGQNIKTNFATINCYDISLNINDKQSILWSSFDGKQEYPTLKSISYNSNGCELVLSNGAKVGLENRGNEIFVTGEAKEAGMAYIKISALQNEVKGIAGGALFSVVASDTQTVLTQTSSEVTFNALAVACQTTKNLSARICSVGNMSPLQEMILKYDYIDDMSLLYSQFRLRSYRGWLTGRYNPQTKMWQDKNGRDHISSELVNAFVSEAYDRREPLRAIELVNQEPIFSYELVNSQRYENLKIAKVLSSLPSAIFFGEMEETIKGLKQNSKSLFTSLQNVNQTKELSFFQNPYLVEIVVLLGSENQIQKLISILPMLSQETDPSTLVAGIAHGIYLYKLYPELSVKIEEDLHGAIERLINYISFDANFAAIAKNGKLSTYDTMLAALVLRDAALLKIGNNYGELSSLLFMAYMENANDYGVAKDSTFFLSGKESNGSQNILPESIYPWIKGEGCFPKLQRYDSNSSGEIFCYHRSRSLEIREWGSTIALNFVHYQIGGAEHYALTSLNNFIVKGVKPYNSVSMWGNSSWPADTGYELWRIGYAYFEEDSLITAMLRHRSVGESFTISF